MSVFPEEHEPLNAQSSAVPAGVDVGSDLEDAAPHGARRSEGSLVKLRSRAVVVLLGLVTVGLLRGGFLGWQYYSPTKSSPTDAQIKQKVESGCEEPKGVCTEDFLEELVSVSAALKTAQKDIVKNRPLLQKYQQPTTDTCNKVTAMSGLCTNLNIIRKKEAPHGSLEIHQLGLPRLQPKVEADLEAHGDSIEKYDTTFEAYGSIMKSLNTTATELNLQCSAVNFEIRTVCSDFDSPSIPAAQKSMKAISEILQADAKKTVAPQNPKEREKWLLGISDSSQEASKWNKLFNARENKLKADKTELKHRLADDMQVKLDEYELQTQSWMEKKIEKDFADANAEFRSQVAEGKAQAEEARKVTAQKLKEEADEILADAIAEAKEENAEKKKQDAEQMENKIKVMKENLKKHLMNSLGYNKQILQIKEDAMKKVRTKVDELEAKQNKELDELEAKKVSNEIQAAKDSLDEDLPDKAEDLEEAVDQKQKELDDQAASDLSKYQEGLKTGNFQVGSLSMNDYLNVHLELNSEKRENLIAQYVHKEKMKLEKQTKKDIAYFKAQGENAVNAQNMDKFDLGKAAKQKIKDQIFEAKGKNYKDLKAMTAKWKADAEAERDDKIQKVQEAASKVIPGKVDKAEKELRAKIAEKQAGHAKEPEGKSEDKIEKRAEREEKQTMREYMHDAKMAFHDAMHASRNEWEDQAQQLNLKKEEELEDELDAQLKVEAEVLEDAYYEDIKHLKEVQDKSDLARQVPEDRGSKIMESVAIAASICTRLGKIKQNCIHEPILTTNETLIQIQEAAIQRYCKETAVFHTTCDEAFAWNAVESIVANLQEVHDVATAGTQWIESTATARAFCGAPDNTDDDKEKIKEDEVISLAKEDKKSKVLSEDDDKAKKLERKAKKGSVTDDDKKSKDDDKDDDKQSKDDDKKSEDEDKKSKADDKDDDKKSEDDDKKSKANDKDDDKKSSDDDEERKDTAILNKDYDKESTEDDKESKDEDKDEVEESSEKKDEESKDEVEESSEKKDGRRLDDKSDAYVMQDVMDRCAGLGKEIADSMDETKHEKEKALQSAKKIDDSQDDTASVNDVQMQLRTSRDKVLDKTVNVRHKFEGLMSEVSDRFDTMARGFQDFTIAAKAPCVRLPAQWQKFDRLFHNSDYFVDFFAKWVILDVKKSCEAYRSYFSDCVTRFHAQQDPMFELSMTQAWRLEDVVQPLVRSIQMGLVLTCVFIFFSHKNPSLLLNGAFFASQIALFCLMTVTLMRGCIPVGLGFALLLWASVHRYLKILPKSTFVSVALKCAATALESTLGHEAWIAMIPALFLQAIVLFSSLGTALHLQERCEWPLIPALALPLIAGVWTSEVIACVFRSAVGCAVSLAAVRGREAGITQSAVKSVLGRNQGLGGIAVWAFLSALPFRSQSSSSAVDLIEVALPQEDRPNLGHSWGWGHSLWLRDAVVGEGALGSATDGSFTEALRIVRLALALMFSIVTMGAPIGSMNTALVAMTAIVIGHTLVAVPVHSLEASLWGFAAAVEEVGSDHVKTNENLRDLLAQVVIQKREVREEWRQMRLVET